MTECGAQVRLARIKFRLAVAASATVVCSLAFIVLMQVPANDAQNNGGAVVRESTSGTPSSGYRSPATPSNIATHKATADEEDDGSDVPREMQQINQMIEERLQRDRLLQCALLPFL